MARIADREEDDSAGRVGSVASRRLLVRDADRRDARRGRGGVAIVASWSLLFATACADVSFKPGASPDAIRRDEIACREAAGEDEEEYASCMKARGYLVSKSGEGLGWTPAGR